MFGKLATLVVNITGNAGPLNAQINIVQRNLIRLQSLSSRFSNFFVLGGAVYALKALVDQLEKIETGFIRIERVARDFKGGNFRGDIFNLAQGISGVSIEELQRIMKVSAQLGIRGRADLLKFTETVAIMANVTGISADLLATDIGKIIQVFSILPRDVDRVANSILQVADDFNATESEITNIVRRIGAFSKSIGLSVDETIAFAAAMKDVGVNTEIAASSLYTFFARLQTNPVKIAKLFGYTSEEEIFNFFKRLRNEPVEAIVTLLQKIKSLSPGEKLLFFKDLELYGVRNAAALGTLAEKVDRLKEALGSANTGLRENSRLLQNQWDVANSLRGRIDDLTDSWKRFYTTIGNTEVLGRWFSVYSHFLDAISSRIEALSGGKTLDVDVTNLKSVSSKITELRELIRASQPKEGIKDSDSWIKKWIAGVLGFADEVGGTRENKRQLALLEKIQNALVAKDKFEAELKKPISDNELRRELNIIRAADEKKGSKDKFSGFMGLTDAWKNLILDRMEGKDKSFEKLEDIHDEAAEINAGVDEVASILRNRTFPAVLS